MIGAKKVYTGVMLNHGDFYVVVSCDDCGDRRLTYVVCPFQSNKLGFVDWLNTYLDKIGLKVLSYRADGDLTYIFVDNGNTDLRDIVKVVDEALMIWTANPDLHVTEEMKRVMRQFLLATHSHWMTREKYDLLNSITNGRD